MKNETEDIVYRCKDCSKHNLCQYYYRRKETSQICHYFELPERKTGKWISSTPLPMEADSYKHKRYWKCSVCGGHDFFNPQYSEKIKFCRYCGAELEVDDVRESD